MAVINSYVRSTFLDATSGKLIKLDNTIAEQGSRMFILQSLFACAATDNDGSIYRVFANVPPTYVPIWGTLAGSAMAGFTSASLGLYLPNGGVAKAAACFMSAVSIAAGKASAAPGVGFDAFSAIGFAATPMYGQKLIDLAGDTISNPPKSYDICLLATTRGAVAGTLLLTLVFAQG